MKKWMSCLTAAILLLSLSACSGGQSPDDKAAATTTTQAAATSSKAPATTAAKGNINFLTGEEDMTNANTRPVAIMVANDSSVRSFQHGLEDADMLIEGETEGGITRIMAVFSDVSRVPDMVGPVRSARTPFVKLATSLDAVYCHCGGSPGGLSTLRQSGLAEIDGQTYDGGLDNQNGNTYWRDRSLYNSINWEHSMVTSGQKLASRIQNLELRTKGNNASPFTFGGKKGTASGKQAQIYLSPSQTISFQYDAKDGRYYKRNGTLTNSTVHVSASGVQLSAANVLVMYDSSRYVEQTSTWGSAIYGYDMSSGTGKLLTGGTARDVQWSRSDSGLSFTETDGTPLSVAKGTTYLCFAYSGYADNTIIQ